MAGCIGLQLWSLTSTSTYLPDGLTAVPDQALRALAVPIVVDLAVGVAALGLLPLRRRRPVLVALTTASLSAVSGSSGGAAAFATVSMTTRRRWGAAALVAAVWAGGAVAYQLIVLPLLLPVDYEPSVGFTLVVLLGLYVVLVLIGSYVGARRDLFASLRQRAETAELEQNYRAEAAREAERVQIAREMHDVLAHRISLVAMHANVLAYRTDLPAEQLAPVAKIVQENAHQALSELRQVLGVLRGGPGEGGAEPPQPTLADLPALLAEAEAAGTPVTVEDGGPAGSARHVGAAGSDLTGPPAGPTSAEMSRTVSRTAYRIIQESLTNVRKHAAGAAVRVRLERVGDWLHLEVRNAAGRTGNPTVPGAAMGLAGLAERAQLAGGSLEHGPDPDGGFGVRARLPWR